MDQRGRNVEDVNTLWKMSFNIYEILFQSSYLLSEIYKYYKHY
jgi:hypothetical protein